MNVLVICGPTASGKTSLAFAIAKLLPSVNILSVDSRQIYQGLDLVTGKDIPESLPANIHFYGLDLIPPDQTMNLAGFVQYTKPIISKSITENIPLIIVGGTGLYLKALTQTLSNLSTPPNAALRENLDKLDTENLQELLFDLDPEKILSLNNSDIHNPRRLIRAIEIAKSIPSPKESPRQVHLQGDSLQANFTWLGLHSNKETQRKNIHQRVLDRLQKGATEEVKDLLDRYPNKNLPIFTSFGVKEITQYLDGLITREQLIELWTNAEIGYARRQMVWFKKQPDIIWYDKGSHTLAKDLAEILQKHDKKKTP